jgi:hypothetical protein
MVFPLLRITIKDTHRYCVSLEARVHPLLGVAAIRYRRGLLCPFPCPSGLTVGLALPLAMTRPGQAAEWVPVHTTFREGS